MKQRTAMILSGLLLLLLPVIGFAAVGDNNEDSPKVLWEPETPDSYHETGNWEETKRLTIPAGSFADVKTGDMIAVEFEGSKVRMYLKNGDAFETIRLAGDKDQIDYKQNVNTFVYTVTGNAPYNGGGSQFDKSDVELLKAGGMQFSGEGIKIKKVSMGAPVKLWPLNGESGAFGDNGAEFEIPHTCKFAEGGSLILKFSAQPDEAYVSKYKGDSKVEDLTSNSFKDELINGMYVITLTADQAASMNDTEYTYKVRGKKGELSEIAYFPPANGKLEPGTDPKPDPDPEETTVTEVVYENADGYPLAWSSEPFVITKDKFGSIRKGSRIILEISGDGAQIQPQFIDTKTAEWGAVTFNGVDYIDVSGGSYTYAVTMESVPMVDPATKNDLGTSEWSDLKLLKSAGMRIAGNDAKITKVTIVSPKEGETEEAEEIVTPPAPPTPGNDETKLWPLNDESGDLDNWDNNTVIIPHTYLFREGGQLLVRFSQNPGEALIQKFKSRGDFYQQGEELATITNLENGVFTLTLTKEQADLLNNIDYFYRVKGSDGIVSEISYIRPAGTELELNPDDRPVPEPIINDVPEGAVDIMNITGGSNYLSEGGDWQNDDIQIDASRVAKWEMYGRIRVYLDCDTKDGAIATDVNNCAQVEIQRVTMGDDGHESSGRPAGIDQFLVAAPTTYVEWMITSQEQIDVLTGNTENARNIVKGQRAHVLGIYYLPPLADTSVTGTPIAYENLSYRTDPEHYGEEENKYGVIVYFNDEGKSVDVGGSYTSEYSHINNLESRDIVYVVYRKTADAGENDVPSITLFGGEHEIGGALVEGPDENGYYTAEYRLNSEEAEYISEGGIIVKPDNEQTSIWTLSLVKLVRNGFVFTYEPAPANLELRDAFGNVVTDEAGNPVYVTDENGRILRDGTGKEMEESERYDAIWVTGFNLSYGEIDATDGSVANSRGEGYPVECGMAEGLWASPKAIFMNETLSDVQQRWKVVGVKAGAFDVNRRDADGNSYYDDFLKERAVYNNKAVHDMKLSRRDFFAKYWPVTIPVAYNAVQEGAFENSPFGNVDIRFQTISPDCFKGSASLTKVKLNGFSNLGLSLSIGAGAFADTKVKEISFPKETVMIGADAFSGAPLTLITLNGQKDENAPEPEDTDELTYEQYLKEVHGIDDPSKIKDLKKPEGVTDGEWAWYIKHLTEENFDATDKTLPYNSDASSLKIYPGAFDGMTEGAIDLTGCEVPPMCVSVEGDSYKGVRSWHSFYFIRNKASVDGCNLPEELGGYSAGGSEAGNKLTPFGDIVSAHLTAAPSEAMAYASDEEPETEAATGKVALKWADGANKNGVDAAQYKASPVWTLFFDQPKPGDFILTGVADIEDAASDEIVDVWTLSGVRVNREYLEPGVYAVRRANGKTEKIVIR